MQANASELGLDESNLETHCVFRLTQTHSASRLMGNPAEPFDTQPRTCPTAGPSVSSRAKTCLICGADLTQPVAPAAPGPQAKPGGWAFPWRIVALVAGVIVLLVAGGALVLRPRMAAPLPRPRTL